MMSNNEEKMRAEFNRVLPIRTDLPDGSIIQHYTEDEHAAALDGWQAATASKQQEIDALNQQLIAEYHARCESLKHPSPGHDYWEHYFGKKCELEKAKLNKQVLELSAMVEKMREALLQINLAASATVCNQEWIARRAENALSLSPSTALRDYVNEEVAKLLEGMLKEHRRFPHDGKAALNERRNRK